MEIEDIAHKYGNLIALTDMDMATEAKEEV